jgi:hypothetical protein
MALWFRSKMLVVINVMIFTGILAAYFALSPSIDLANFSFAVVAHLSARIMNWQRERLTLRTEAMRSLYLLIAFGCMMYAIYMAVPAQLRSLAWSGATLGYFGLGLALRNVKYRWMAVAALLATVVNLFLVDLSRLEPRLRVVAFLVLGCVALVISLFYSRMRRGTGRTPEDGEP